MNVIADGVAWLRKQQLAHTSDEALYRRPGAVERTVRATAGRSAWDATDADGAVVRIENVDFIVPAEDLETAPEKGDRLVFDGREYEVLSPGGEPPWRWSDVRRTAMRIHTKLVEGR